MFVICLNINGNNQIVNSDWKTIIVNVPHNRVEHATVRLKHVSLFVNRAYSALSTLGNVLEVRNPLTLECVKMEGSIKKEGFGTDEVILFDEHVAFKLSELLNRSKMVNLEYRILSSVAASRQQLFVTIHTGYYTPTIANNDNLNWSGWSSFFGSSYASDFTNLSLASNGLYSVNDNDTVVNDLFDPNFGTLTHAGTNGLLISSKNIANLIVSWEGTNPQIVFEGSGRQTINSQSFKYIHVRFRWVTYVSTPDRMRLYYYSSTNPYNSNRFVDVMYSNVSVSQWQNIVFDMSNNATWNANNWQFFRLEMVSSGSGLMVLEHFVISSVPSIPDFIVKSLRWSGYMVPRKTGTYRFVTRSDDGCTVYVDNSKIIANRINNTTTTVFANVELLADKVYAFMMMYGNYTASNNFTFGYLEPLSDGTNSGSTNINDFTTNFEGKNMLFQQHPGNIIHPTVQMVMEVNV